MIWVISIKMKLTALRFSLLKNYCDNKYFRNKYGESYFFIL